MLYFRNAFFSTAFMVLFMLPARLLADTAGAADSLVVISPRGPQNMITFTILDSVFTVVLLDTLGQELPGVPVRFRVIYGDGAFVDSNGVSLISPVDSLAVVTDFTGMARTRFKTGVSDSIAVAAAVVGNPGVKARYFVVVTMVNGFRGPSVIHFKSIPDSIVADSTNPITIITDVSDTELIKAIKLQVVTNKFVIQEGVGLAQNTTADTMIADSIVAGYDDYIWAIDSVHFIGTIQAQPVGTLVRYGILVIDAQDDTTVSDTHSYLVSPRRGKYNLSPEPTNVADLLRCVWLVLGAAEATVMDYLGLDLDSSGYFDTSDLEELFAIWRNSG